GNYGYVGFGTNNETEFSDLYQYDPSTNSWTQQASLGIGMQYPLNFVINNIAYVGMGFSASKDSVVNRLYAFNPKTDGWIQTRAFPGVPRLNGIGFSAGNKGYVGLGFGQINGAQGPLLNDIWQYDPATDSWTQKTSFPGSIIPSYPAVFMIDSLSFIAGTTWSSSFTFSNLLWEYNTVTDVWTQKNNFPGETAVQANAMDINNTGYLLSGGENWKYNQASDSWTQLPFFTQRLAGSAFAIGNYGYFGLGYGFPGPMNTDLWQFTPGQ
ncbi:MAG TPA: hypothetical protein VKR53_17660, partial [Puia sp.]|nr:hypothetical protein [Puia sp.]